MLLIHINLWQGLLDYWLQLRCPYTSTWASDRLFPEQHYVLSSFLSSGLYFSNLSKWLNWKFISFFPRWVLAIPPNSMADLQVLFFKDRMIDNITKIILCISSGFLPTFKSSSNFAKGNLWDQLKQDTYQVDEHRTMLKTSYRLKLILRWLLTIHIFQAKLSCNAIKSTYNKLHFSNKCISAPGSLLGGEGRGQRGHHNSWQASLYFHSP